MVSVTARSLQTKIKLDLAWHIAYIDDPYRPLVFPVSVPTEY